MQYRYHEDWLNVRNAVKTERLLRFGKALPRLRNRIAKNVDVANKIEGHTICAFGDAAAWPVQSFMKHYRHEFEYMIDNGGRSIVDDPARRAA